jgi:hypothetical protein
MPKALNAWKLVALVAAANRLHLPPGGWNASNFAKYGPAMVATLHRVARLSILPVQRRITNIVHRRFLTQVGKLVESARSKSFTPLATKAQIHFHPPEGNLTPDEWAKLINDALADEDVKLVAELEPAEQSIISQGYSRTAGLIQVPEQRGINEIIAREAKQVAAQVTRINETTRRQMEQVIRKSIANGDSVTDTARALHEDFPSVLGHRSVTIGRTESMRAWNQGSVRAFQGSGAVTHVSVIGCTSREYGSWFTPSYLQYMFNAGRGLESTCNIQDVLVTDADKLNFHPNHTGTIVPSKFRNADGTVSR